MQAGASGLGHVAVEATVAELLQYLPPQQRRAVELRYGLGADGRERDVAEVARALKVGGQRGREWVLGFLVLAWSSARCFLGINDRSASAERSGQSAPLQPLLCVPAVPDHRLCWLAGV